MDRVTHIRRYSVAGVLLGLAHGAFCLVTGQCLLTSNVFQFLTALLAATYCYSVARRTSDRHLRTLWLLLSSAFCLWTAAQGYFTAVLLVTRKLLEYPSTSDALWLAFALPLLLIVVRQRSKTAGDWISLLDTGQAGLFFSLLGVLVFSRSAGLLITQAYDVQGVALVLLCGLQYSRSHGADKRFFRDLGIYLFSYAVMSSSAYRIEASGFPPGTIVDLCWSVPPVLFIIVSEMTQHRALHKAEQVASEQALFSSSNLYGTSALGLFLLSLLIGVFLHQHEPVLGFVYIGVASLVFAIRMVGRESQIFSAHHALQESCLRDGVTGLFNRFALMSGNHCTIKSGTTLLLCNLDRLRFLNESFGRVLADKVLAETGHRIRRCQNVEEVFRIGGDEFLAVLHRGLLSAETEATNILQQISMPLLIEGRSVSTSAVIGCVELAEISTLSEALFQADAAVTYGKQHGRNQVVTFHRGMLCNSAARVAFEADLKAAIKNGHIKNYYQPIYCTQTQVIVGFEALARWVKDGQVVAAPDKFIPVAEDTWMILDLGRKLLTQACEDAALMTKLAGRPIWVSVNLSGKQVFESDFLHQLKQEVHRTGINPASLKVEVTESVLLDDLAQAAAIFNELRAFGVRIALDDFGTGFSSLSYLASLPFDILKIDKSFVTGLESGTERFTVTCAIVQLAAKLGKEIVAEGIETATEEEQLVSMGCTLLQGYRISRPLPVENAVALLRQQSKPTVHHATSEKACCQLSRTQKSTSFSVSPGRL